MILIYSDFVNYIGKLSLYLLFNLRIANYNISVVLKMCSLVGGTDRTRKYLPLIG